MKLVMKVYEATRSFPPEEVYGLAAQLRRAAVSVPSNLAEGAARESRREFAQFVNIARGSLSEIETQLLIAVELGYIDRAHDVFETTGRVSQLIGGLHRSLCQ